MGKTTYMKCVELLNRNFKKGDEVGLWRLSSLVKMYLGSDPRTIKNILQTMLDTRLIKDIGKGHFKILNAQQKL